MQSRRAVLALIVLVVVLVSGLAQAVECSAEGVATLLEAHFDSDADGFVYEDDPFGTTNPGYASGSYELAEGYSGGGVVVLLGGLDESAIAGMSGGWTYTLNLAGAETGVVVSLRYRMATPTYYEYDEFSRVLLGVDGTLYGRGSKSYVDHIGGDGDSSGPTTHDTRWQWHEAYIGSLAAGSHALTIGAYNNRKDASNETTTATFDDVVVTSGNPEPASSAAQILVDRVTLQQFKADLQAVASFGDRCRLIGCAPYSAYYSALTWVESELWALGYTTTRHNYTYGEYSGTNLWATKVGTAHPESMYMITAHLDGRGGGEAADDNASGVSLVLNAARVFAAGDVTTDYSVRFVFWDQEEIALIGSSAYVSERSSLRGIESPPGSGQYPEPNWLGHLAHDMILYDHGVGTPLSAQSPYADLDVEWRDGTSYAAASSDLALTWRFLNGTYSANYPANAANQSLADDVPFHDYCPAVSIRENRRAVSAEWNNPHYHQTSDIYSNYLEDDFRLGLNALQATVGTVAELAGARVRIPIATLGDVNADGAVTSTDALIVLSGDVGIDTSAFCPMNCGDVNGDGKVNSTDALIILSYDAGMAVPYVLGQPGCPSSVDQPAGCG